MSGTIDFFGLCLFAWESDHIRVLLPKTADRGKMRKHDAYFVDRKTSTPNGAVMEPLSGHRVTFETRGSGRPASTGSFRDLIRLDKLGAGMSLKPASELDSLVEAQIILRGGSLSIAGRAHQGSQPCRFVRPNNPNQPVTYTVSRPVCVVRWTPGASEFDCVFERKGFPPKRHRFQTSTNARRRLLIGNVCNQGNPAKWGCEDVPCTGDVLDEDFAWYYPLFNNAVDLLPLASCSFFTGLSANALLTGTTSTCYNGGFCPGGNC